MCNKPTVALYCCGMLGLNACALAPSSEPPQPVAPSLPGAVVYDCTGGATAERIEARYETASDTVTVLFDGRTYRLPQTPSGSGARYSNGSSTWWVKGDEALWQMDENLLLRDCRPAS